MRTCPATGRAHENRGLLPGCGGRDRCGALSLPGWYGDELAPSRWRARGDTRAASKPQIPRHRSRADHGQQPRRPNWRWPAVYDTHRLTRAWELNAGVPPGRLETPAARFQARSRPRAVGKGVVGARIAAAGIGAGEGVAAHASAGRRRQRQDERDRRQEPSPSQEAPRRSPLPRPSFAQLRPSRRSTSACQSANGIKPGVSRQCRSVSAMISSFDKDRSIGTPCGCGTYHGVSI
jgi:hypothetical protein